MRKRRVGRKKRGEKKERKLRNNNVNVCLSNPQLDKHTLKRMSIFYSDGIKTT